MTAVVIATLYAVGVAHFAAMMFRPRGYRDPVYEPSRRPTLRERILDPSVIAPWTGFWAYIAYASHRDPIEAVAAASAAWATTRLLVQRRAEP